MLVDALVCVTLLGLTVIVARHATGGVSICFWILAAVVALYLIYLFMVNLVWHGLMFLLRDYF